MHPAGLLGAEPYKREICTGAAGVGTGVDYFCIAIQYILDCTGCSRRHMCSLSQVRTPKTCGETYCRGYLLGLRFCFKHFVYMTSINFLNTLTRYYYYTYFSLDAAQVRSLFRVTS